MASLDPSVKKFPVRRSPSSALGLPIRMGKTAWRFVTFSLSELGVNPWRLTEDDVRKISSLEFRV